MYAKNVILRMVDISVAEIVIKRWGGATALARALGKRPSSIQVWKDSGTIPLRNWPEIEQAAFREGWLDLTARWLGEAHAAQEVRRAQDAARQSQSPSDKTVRCEVD